MRNNEGLRSLRNVLAQKLADKSADSFVAYLYALVLRKCSEISNSSTDKQIVDALTYSVNDYPMNWSAWSLLSNYVTDITEVS